LGKLGIILLVGFLVSARAAASADVNQICPRISNLQYVYGQSRHAASVDDPWPVIVTLGNLAADIRHSLTIYATAELTRIGDEFSASARALRRAADPESSESATLGARTFTAVSDAQAALAFLDTHFGCAAVLRYVDPVEQRPSTVGSGVFGRHWSQIVETAGVIQAYIWVFAALLALVVAAYVHRGMRRKNPRHMCSIPVLVVYGDTCTVTKMIDISRGGIRIEAAAEKKIDHAWVDLHFCGLKVAGQIQWRNKFYAGVEFRERLSDAVLTKVLGQNRVPIAESHIEETSPPCFAVGCHLNCSRHLQTAIALKKLEATQHDL